MFLQLVALALLLSFSCSFTEAGVLGQTNETNAHGTKTLNDTTTENTDINDVKQIHNTELNTTVKSKFIDFFYIFLVKKLLYQTLIYLFS
jgi:hypothetical protein